MGLNLEEYTALVDSRSPDLGADAVQAEDLHGIAELLRWRAMGVLGDLSNPRQVALQEVRQLVASKRVPPTAIQNLQIDNSGLLIATTNAADAASFGERIIDSSPVLGFNILQKKIFHHHAIGGLQDLSYHPRLRALLLELEEGTDHHSGREAEREVLSAVDQESRLELIGVYRTYALAPFYAKGQTNLSLKILDAGDLESEAETNSLLAAFPKLEEIRLAFGEQVDTLLGTEFAKNGILRVEPNQEAFISPELKAAFGDRLKFDKWWSDKE